MNTTREHERADADLTPTLIGRLRQGHAEAGALLDRLYRERLILFCIGYLGHRQAAEDVVGDVFLRVLESEVVPDRFRAWIFRSCRNRCIDLLRRRKCRPDDRTLLTALEARDDATGDLSRLVGREQRRHLWRVLMDLPEHQREVLRLRYLEQLSRQEIARVLDVPEKLVKSRIYDGLKRMRRHGSLLGEG